MTGFTGTAPISVRRCQRLAEAMGYETRIVQGHQGSIIEYYDAGDDGNPTERWRLLPSWYHDISCAARLLKRFTRYKIECEDTPRQTFHCSIPASDGEWMHASDTQGLSFAIAEAVLKVYVHETTIRIG